MLGMRRSLFCEKAVNYFFSSTQIGNQSNDVQKLSHEFARTWPMNKAFQDCSIISALWRVTGFRGL